MQSVPAVPPIPPFGSEVVMLLFSGALWGATCVQTCVSTQLHGDAE